MLANFSFPAFAKPPKKSNTFVKTQAAPGSKIEWGDSLERPTTKRARDWKARAEALEKKDPKFVAPLNSTLRNETLNPKHTSSYSLAVDTGFASQNLKPNHLGYLVGLRGGMVLRRGLMRDHWIMPRLVFDHQGLFHKIGPLMSKAQTYSLGIEMKYLYEAVPTWLHVGAAFGLGAVFYRSKGDDIGLKGTMVNNHNRLRALKTSGLHVEIGPELCTWGARFCLAVKYQTDQGMGVYQNLDGSTAIPADGFNGHGVSVALQTDIMRFFDWPSAKTVIRKHESPGKVRKKSPKGPGRKS